MYRLKRLLTALIIFSIGVALLPFISLPAEAFSWELFANAYQDQPTLTINNDLGKPGSFFEVKGEDFPANTTATIIINGTTLGSVPTDAKGDFAIELNTTGADEGAYFVTGAVNPSAMVKFVLDNGSPNTWPAVGTTPLFNVPAGIAFTEFVYLPMIVR